MDSSLTQVASPDCLHDLESLANEATRLGPARLVRVDGYDLRMLCLLSRLRSKATSEYSTVQSEEITFFDSMKKLSDKLLEFAGAMAPYERTTYE